MANLKSWEVIEETDWAQRSVSPPRQRLSLFLVVRARAARIVLELGHTEHAGDQNETFFTYEELRQICYLSTNR
jgi:hypothetical protein